MDLQGNNSFFYLRLTLNLLKLDQSASSPVTFPVNILYQYSLYSRDFAWNEKLWSAVLSNSWLIAQIWSGAYRNRQLTAMPGLCEWSWSFNLGQQWRSAVWVGILFLKLPNMLSHKKARGNIFLKKYLFLRSAK